MKYVVKKQIPLIGGTLKVGDVVDSSNGKFGWLDFNHVEFFEPYVESKFKAGDDVLFAVAVKNILICKVLSVSNSGAATIIDDKGIKYPVKDINKLKSPTKFWFINSNGVVQSDYEERRKIDKKGLAFKKMTSNYYKTAELAQLALFEKINKLTE